MWKWYLESLYRQQKLVVSVVISEDQKLSCLFWLQHIPSLHNPTLQTKSGVFGGPTCQPEGIHSHQETHETYVRHFLTKGRCPSPSFVQAKNR